MKLSLAIELGESPAEEPQKEQSAYSGKPRWSSVKKESEVTIIPAAKAKMMTRATIKSECNGKKVERVRLKTH